MRHVLFRGLALRAALVLPVVALALIAATVDAQAAAVTSNSGATVCTNGNPLLYPVFPFQPGNCQWSGDGDATFLGRIINPEAVATPDDPSLPPTGCPNQAADGIDFICGHFGMDFGNVQGTVRVTIAFNAIHDLDLCITDATAFVIVTCSKGSKGTETLTFNVSCTDTRYEAQILPISFGSPGPPLTPVDYSGSVDGDVTPCVPGGGKGEGNPEREKFDHHGGGGGEGENDDNHEHEHNYSDVEERDSDHAKRGKVRYSKPGCDMRSSSIDTITWNDVTRTMTVTGFGTVNGLGSVPFVYSMTDNGPGRADTYTVDSTCSGSGHLTRGDFKYSHRTF